VISVLYYGIVLVLVTLGAATGEPGRVSLAVLPIGAIAILFQKYFNRERIADLGFRLCGRSQAAAGMLFPLVIMVVVFLCDLGLGFLEVEPLSSVPDPTNPARIGVTLPALLGILILGALITALGAGLTEELAFRGYLIRRMKSLGSLKALLLSAVLFGVWHFPTSLFVLHTDWPTRLVYVLNISLLGFLFGHVFLQSRSLIPPSLFHGIWNALDYTFFGFGSTRGIFAGTSRILFDPDEGIVGTVVLLAAVIWVVRKYSAGDRSSLAVEPIG
jgi:membrane protease YdiL (CAAX protease family)